MFHVKHFGGKHMRLKMFLVDAFTDVAYSGNTAAVVIADKELSDIQMTKIAAELKMSETAFVNKDEGNVNTYDIRFFTPLEEVDLCGHATIASFFTLLHIGEITRREKQFAYLNTLAGRLQVEINNKNGNTTIQMEMATPMIYHTAIDCRLLYQILGLEAVDYENIKPWLEPQIVSTGLKDIILPVKDRSTLFKINPNYGELAKFSQAMDVVGVHAFTLDTIDKDSIAHCRNFAPLVGINEEAATGTSSGALAHYLKEHNVLGGGTKTAIFEQGYIMGRPSKIITKVVNMNNDRKVYVGGTAIIVAEGLIKIPDL